MEEDFPPVFDPFSDYTPDFSEYTIDYSSQTILDAQGEVYPSQLATQQIQSLISQEIDPQPTLKQLLEAAFQQEKPAPQDPADLMPEQVFQKHQNFIHFSDSSFAGPYLRSEFSCKNKELPGYVILPATLIPRIRSRGSNHQMPTPVVWVNSETIPQEIRQLFE